ncbi:contact-dependent growth inhibition system immunity protein [Fulvivirga ligni]|uniref:contact-dependent growth inhibition system immunity protein n=1 Tax=Fulvivirga ligni TaxID=2904246 RepID=UPI001F297433|nr:contact-dependent growth inhibition system immunity protein [Fulvivirga ligni]UII19761.1 hypothetical protein LVD16_18115 [Fulvivirga ligni]
MNFDNKYPKLFQFFAGYFPEADLDGFTDEEVVENFCADNPEDLAMAVSNELKQLIKDNESWSEALEVANRYFESNDQTESWMLMILKHLDEKKC